MRLVNPLSLFFAPDGFLWVTENRQSPKRLTRWDVDKGEVVYEKLGSESYGAPGCGMDPADPNHWLAQDAEWRIDPATGREEAVGSPVYDESTGLLYASAGTGRINAYRLDGALEASYRLPGAEPFRRFDTMVHAGNGRICVYEAGAQRLSKFLVRESLPVPRI